METDRIEREITIAAPVERVWAVLTEPEYVATWFGAGTPTDIDLRPGGIMELDHGVYGRYPTVLTVVDPPHALSYRWAGSCPGAVATEDNSTLVEFTLEPTGTGTRLRVVESGFDALAMPPDRVDIAGFESHTQGWPDVVAKLAELAEGGAPSPLVAPE